MLAKKFEEFINGKYFIYTVGIIVFLVWLTGTEVAGFLLLTVFGSTTLLRQKSCAPFAVTMCMAYFCISLKDVPDVANGVIPLQEQTALVAVVIADIVYMVFCAIFRTIKYGAFKKTQFDMKPAFITVLAAILFAGLFAPGYKLSNGLLMIVLYILVFAIYLVFSDSGTENFKDHMAEIIAVIGIVVLAECIVFFARHEDPLNALQFKWLDLGWGIANTAATVLNISAVMALYLYLAKDRVVYLVMAAVTLIAAVLTMSRGNIMAMLIMSPFLLWLMFAKSKNKRKTIITVSAFAVLAIIFCILRFDVVSKIFDFTFTKGAYNEDRRLLWGQFARMFAEQPMFGNGFYDAAGNVFLQHSVMIIIASSMGAAGLAAFGYHYYKKYQVLATYKTLYSCFAVIACFLYVAYSVIDMGFYMVYENILIVGLLEAAKQERALLKPPFELKMPLKISVPMLTGGIALAVISAVCLAIAPVQTSLGYQLSEWQFAGILIGFICAAAAINSAAQSIWFRLKTTRQKK